jgi:hypothetical protein
MLGLQASAAWSVRPALKVRRAQVRPVQPVSPVLRAQEALPEQPEPQAPLPRVSAAVVRSAQLALPARKAQ